MYLIRVCEEDIGEHGKKTERSNDRKNQEREEEWKEMKERLR